MQSDVLLRAYCLCPYTTHSGVRSPPPVSAHDARVFRTSGAHTGGLRVARLALLRSVIHLLFHILILDKRTQRTFCMSN